MRRSGRASSGRSPCCGGAFTPELYDVVHAQDCISANGSTGASAPCITWTISARPELAACHERAIVVPLAHICVSAAVAAEVEAGWGIRATVIPNGVDASRFAFAAVRTARLARRGGAGGDRLGRTCSRSAASSRARARLTCFPLMRCLFESSPDVRLVIAGGETCSTTGTTARHGQARRPAGHFAACTRPGGARRTAVACRRRRCVLLPSLKEGFGLDGDGGARGRGAGRYPHLPVLREVFRDAARFATDPAGFADQMVAALGDPDSHRSAGRRWPQYTWDAAAAGTLPAMQKSRSRPA